MVAAAQTEFALGPVAQNWQSPGPRNLQYLNSTSPVVIGMGPVGCAKTSTAFMKGLVNTTRQPVLLTTGRKECKITVLADTYKTIHNKVLDTFWGIVPEGSPFTKRLGGKGEDVQVEFIWGSDGLVHRTLWHFLAVGDKSIEAITAGMLTTCVHLYEPDHLPEQVIDESAKRTPRWPHPSALPDGEHPFSQIYGDMNAPNDTHPLYRRLSLGLVESDEFIEWPSGFSHDAENLMNLHKLKPDYYRQLAASMADPLMIARMIENKVGYSRSGKPVYQTYRSDIHTSKAVLAPQGDLPLIIGVDGGGSAAAVVCQPTFSGGLHILEEIVTEAGDFTDAKSFGDRVARVLSTKYPGKAAVAAIDPANMNRSASSDDMRSWFAQFQLASGLRCFPGGNKSNRINERLTAVRTLLGRLVDGKGALQINGHCTVLREGFQSGYKIREMKTNEGTTYKEAPDKGHFSHIHDALQYACLFFLNSSNRLHDAVSMASSRHPGKRSKARQKVLVRNR